MRTQSGLRFCKRAALPKTKLLIAVISAQTEKSLRQRDRVRRSWFKSLFADMPRSEVDARFFTAVEHHDGDRADDKGQDAKPEDAHEFS